MFKIYIILFTCLPWIGFNQQTIVSDGKQKILLQNDGSYQILSDDGLSNVLPITHQDLVGDQNFEVWKQATKIIEAEYFVQIYTLQKEIDVLHLELKQANTAENIKVQEDCKNKIKELRIKLKDTERLYDNALYYKKLALKLEESNLDKNRKKFDKLLTYVRSKDYLFKTIQYRNQDVLQWSPLETDEISKEEITEKYEEADTIIREGQNSLIVNECRLVTRKFNDEVEVIHDFFPVFNYTPERLQIFLKNENLLDGSIRLKEKNKMFFMDLQIVLKSKDAAKSYGHIPEGNLIRIEFINGLRLNLKSNAQILGRIEEYSGKVVYMVSFGLDKEMMKPLEKLPVNNIGVMWSSGFEIYEVYEVDVIMRQLDCIKSVNTL